MRALSVLRDRLPAHAHDIRHNLDKIFSAPTPRTWGAALAAAIASGHAELITAIADDASTLEPALLEDARAAAVMMAMTSVYYRFKHFMRDPDIDALPSRLRMKRTARPSGERVDFELFCVAASAVHACEACVRHHAEAARELGATGADVADAARTAAVICGVATALSIPS